MFNVLIIGAGNIGFRHFEGLLNTALPLAIHIIDPNLDALNRVNQRYKETGTKEKACFYYQNELELPEKIDVCIVATSSKVRLEVTEAILKKTAITYLILEKVLFQKEADYEKMSALLLKHDVKGCWVNCPLRTYPIYSELKEKLTGKLEISLEYGKFGIGCNSIHYLDLFSYFTDSLNMNIDVSNLGKVVQSKRQGYLEVLGILNASSPNGDRLIIRSNGDSTEEYTITINVSNEQWTIYPFTEKIVIVNKLTKEQCEKTFWLPKQSEVTGMIVTDILLYNKCGLLEYEMSKQLHVNLIRELNLFFSKAFGYEVTECPIT